MMTIYAVRHQLQDLGAGGMRLRGLMTLLAVAKVSRQPGKGRGFAAWLWDLLDGRVGELLTSIGTEEAEAAVADEAHIVCMSQVRFSACLDITRRAMRYDHPPPRRGQSRGSLEAFDILT